MIHARSDYNRIQDPAGLIAEDEPVFLLRAKDAFAPATLIYWASLVEPHDQILAESIVNFADFMREWQVKNISKIPDTPNDVKWNG